MAIVTQGFVNILKRAKELSFDLGYTGTEHLVYAMFFEPNFQPARILSEFKITREIYENIYKECETIRKLNDYSPNARAAFDMANKFAVKNRFSYISECHLFYSILSINDCKATSILRRIGVSIDKMKDAVLRSINIMNVQKPKIDIMDDKTDSKGHEIIENPYDMLDVDSDFELNDAKANDERIDYIDFNASKKAKLQTTDQEFNINDLNEFGYDLTKKAREGRIDPVVGRNEEIERVIQVLSRKNKNNPVLVGEAGVGKSAVVEGLALKIASGDVPENLRNKIVFSLDLGGMVAGTKYRGEFEERIKKVIDTAINDERIIFFIDEIHNLVGAGSSSDDKLDAAEMLKPLLSRGEVSVVGATTSKEYTKYIESNAALERRFQPIYVEEPKVEDAITILNGIKGAYETHHRVVISDEAIVAAVKLSSRYIQDRFLPDKAIDLIDEAAAQKRLAITSIPSRILNLENEIERIKANESYALSQNDLDQAKKYAFSRKELEDEIRQEKEKILDERSNNLQVVTDKDIKELISKVTKIPVSDLTESEKDKLLSLKDDIKKKIIGQDDAIDVVVRAIKRSSAKLKDPNRPIGTFIFAGPTGVGKTQFAKVIAETVFNNKEAFISFDMSEYQDKSSISKLIGAAPGFVGYDEEGLLTDRVRRRPYSVVVFDEIEKAAPELFDLLLQVLDEGRLTDSKGRVVNFKNTIIILTSNIGFSNVQTKTFGFGNLDDQQKEKIEDELKLRFKPEFINRLDEVVVFNKLVKEDCFKIVEIFLDDLKNRFLEQNINVEFENSAIELILNTGFSSVYGARPIKRTVERLIEDLFADELIVGNIDSGDNLVVFAENNEICYRKK